MLSLMLKVATITWYEVNKSFIVAELCEQKAVENNKCQGHCQLTKKLDATENPSSDAPIEVEPLTLLTFMVPSENASANNLEYLITEFSAINSPEKLQTVITDVFRPPVV